MSDESSDHLANRWDLLWVQGDPSTAVERDLESFGLTDEEARVLVALLRTGMATSSQLGVTCPGLPAGAGPALDALSVKGLAEPVPGGEGVWTSVGRDEVINRLFLLQEERLQRIQIRMEQTRRALADLVPESSPASMSDVHLVRGAAQCERTYEGLLSEALVEVMVFNRPPYGFGTTMLNQCIMEMLARGVETRVLYRARELELPGAEVFRSETARYMHLGVNAGVVDELPLKMAVVDRRVALVTPVGPDDADGFPTSLLIENAGFVLALAGTFEHYWRNANSVSGLLGLGL